MCARHGRGLIEICLSEKGELAKKRLGNTKLVECEIGRELRSATNLL